MEVKLTTAAPAYKRRLKSGINPWSVAAVVGLVGTWISGTEVRMGGNLMNHQLNVAVTPMTFIISLIWIAIVFWWYKDRTSRTSKFAAAAANNPDVLCLDDFGVTWGVAGVATTKIAWSAVAFYRLTSSQLELGLPAGKLAVSVDELGKDTNLQELEAFLQSKAIRKAS